MATEVQAQIFASARFAEHSFQGLLSFYKRKGFLCRSNSPAQFAYRKYGALTQCALKEHFRFQPQPTPTILAVIPQIFSGAQLTCTRGNIIIGEKLLRKHK